MWRRLIVLGMAGVMGGSPITAAAQSCNSAAQVTADLWNIWDDFYDDICSRNEWNCLIAHEQQIKDNTIQQWNQLVGSSWATIGPRRLDFNRNHTGTIVGTAGRMFVSLQSFSTPVTITIDETGGRGKTSVVVCRVDSQNRRTQIATRWFNDTNARKNKSDERRTVRVDNAQGRIVTVHFDGKSVGNSFSYRIRASN